MVSYMSFGDSAFRRSTELRVMMYGKFEYDIGLDVSLGDQMRISSGSGHVWSGLSSVVDMFCWDLR